MSNGETQTTIRVSDHALPAKYVDQYGQADFQIDINGTATVPFNTISKKLNGGEVKTSPTPYAASDKIRTFEAQRDTMSDAQVVQYANGNSSDAKLRELVNNEIEKRGITPEQMIALADAPIETPTDTTAVATIPEASPFPGSSKEVRQQAIEKAITEGDQTAITSLI